MTGFPGKVEGIGWGKVLDVRQAWQIRERRSRADGQDETPRVHHCLACGDCGRADEPRPRDDDLDALRGQVLGRYPSADSGSHCRDVLAGLVEVDLERRPTHAEGRTPPQ